MESHESCLSKAVGKCNFRKIHLQKNVFIESSGQFSFLRCQEYDFKDFVDGENYAVWRTGFKIEQSIECQSLTQIRCITEF